MKRRKFLTIAGIGATLAAVASGKFLTTSFDRSIEILIREELDFMKLDEEGVKRFAKEYSKTKSRNFRFTIRAYNYLGITASRSGKIHQLITQYLLSTDFFINKMDESRLIKYVGFYNPYTRPCVHPFSHLNHPST